LPGGCGLAHRSAMTVPPQASAPEMGAGPGLRSEPPRASKGRVWVAEPRARLKATTGVSVDAARAFSEEVLALKVVALEEQLTLSAFHGSELLAQKTALEEAAQAWTAKERQLMEQIEDLEHEAEALRDRRARGSQQSGAEDGAGGGDCLQRRPTVDAGLFADQLAMAEEWEEERKELERKNERLVCDIKRLAKDKLQLQTTVEELRKELAEGSTAVDMPLKGTVPQRDASADELQEQLDGSNARIWELTKAHDELRATVDTVMREKAEQDQQLAAFQSESELCSRMLDEEKIRSMCLEAKMGELTRCLFRATSAFESLYNGAGGADRKSGSLARELRETSSVACFVEASPPCSPTHQQRSGTGDCGGGPQFSDAQLPPQQQAERLKAEFDLMRTVLSSSEIEGVLTAQETEAKLVTITAERDSLQARLQEAEAKLAEVRAQSDILQARAEEIAAQLSSVMGERDELQASKASDECAKVAAAAEGERLRAELTGLRDRLRSELASEAQRRPQIARTIRHLKAEVEALRTGEEAACAKLRAAEEKIEALRREVSQLRQQLMQAEADDQGREEEILRTLAAMRLMDHEVVCMG